MFNQIVLEMKKIFTIAAAMLLFAGAASAQSYINVGYGKPTDVVKFGDMDPETDSFNTLFAGFSHNFLFGKALGVEAGANFAYGFKKTEELGVDIRYKYTGLNVPVLLNYGLPVGNFLTLKAFAGPTFHYGFSCKNETYADGKKALTLDYYEDGSYNRFFISAGVAVAAEFADTFRVKLGYDLGLTDINKAEKISTKENLFSVTFSYIF